MRKYRALLRKYKALLRNFRALLRGHRAPSAKNTSYTLNPKLQSQLLNPRGSFDCFQRTPRLGSGFRVQGSGFRFWGLV